MQCHKGRGRATAVLGLVLVALPTTSLAHAGSCASYGDQAWNGRDPYAQRADADPHQRLNLDVWSAGSHWAGGWVELCSGAGSHGRWAFRGGWRVHGRIVQAYPHTTRGWDWFQWLPHDRPGGDGFPIRVGHAGLYSKVRYAPGALHGTFDVSYDIWLSDERNPRPGDPLTEIMVWLDRGGGLEPLQNNGGYLGTTSLAKLGGAWDVYAGSMRSTYRGVDMQWPVYSYVSTRPLGTFDGDLQPFLRQVIHRFQHQAKVRSNAMNEHWYVLGVQFGAEPVAGNGQLDVRYYHLQPGTRAQGAFRP